MEPIIGFLKYLFDYIFEQMLLDLAKEAEMEAKISDMFNGKHVNLTEDRAVLHVALRAPRDCYIFDKGEDVVPDVWEVLDKIKAFSSAFYTVVVLSVH